jgi:hypothetical protein
LRFGKKWRKLAEHLLQIFYECFIYFFPEQKNICYRCIQVFSIQSMLPSMDPRFPFPTIHMYIHVCIHMTVKADCLSVTEDIEDEQVPKAG